MLTPKNDSPGSHHPTRRVHAQRPVDGRLLLAVVTLLIDQSTDARSKNLLPGSREQTCGPCSRLPEMKVRRETKARFSPAHRHNEALPERNGALACSAEVEKGRPC